MDHWPLRILIALPIGIIFAQYAVYALPSPCLLKSAFDSYSQAYNRDGFDYGLLTVYCPKVNGKDLVLAMAIVQGARYLGTILLQPLAALCIERGGYQVMSFF